MIEITYFFRNFQAGFSISKVFNTLIDEIEKSKSVERLEVPFRRSGLFDILRNIHFVFKNRNKSGINHITGDIHYCIIGLIGCKSVLTIHDLSAYNFPKNILKKYIVRILWFDIPLLIADEVVCISNHVRSDLEKISNRRDIKVVYNAIDPIFSRIEKEFDITNPVLLQLGTAWNKNLPTLIDSLVDINCNLRIVGNVQHELIQKMLDKNIRFTIVSGLTDMEIVDEYKNCDIVCFCSLFEGFGMPIIEANATGRVVLSSNIEPMKEVSNDAAFLVDPKDINSINQGLRRIILEKDLRDELIQNGDLNILRFQVNVISKLYLDIYTRI